MKQVALNHVGRLDLVDLQALSDSIGRDFMPHPFVQFRPTRFADYDEYAAYTAAAPDRLSHGDLREFNQWFSSYLNADLRVECVVSIVDAPRGRILAHRRGELGFIAAQRTTDHVIDVYTVLPYDLGPAIAGSLALTRPGRQAKIVIPEFVRHPATGADDDAELAIREQVVGSEAVSVPRSAVTRYTRVQSRWQQARDWGFDRDKDVVVCVAIDDDGDYIYAPGFHHLTPMTGQNLSDRIDALIAEDVARLRESRR